MYRFLTSFKGFGAGFLMSWLVKREPWSMVNGDISESVIISKAAICDLPMTDIMDRNTFRGGVHFIHDTIVPDTDPIMS